MFKILVVDDENLIRYSLSATFRDPAFTVRTAANGREALDAIREEMFDVCILDLHLPDMSGIDILQVLRAAAARTKIIIISGETLTRETRKIVENNAVLYLEKPFDLDQVRSYVTLLRQQCLHERAPAEDRTGAADRRRNARSSSDRCIRYSAVTPGGEAKGIDLEATLHDISDTGMRLFTDHPLEPGWWVLLSDGSLRSEGVVRWSRAANQQGTFHVGVQISGPAA
jgi:CheY-like chemotaxis protein